MAPHDTHRDQLLDLAYGELGRREERDLRAHLETCPECRAELDRIASTRSAMAALGDEPAPERGLGTLLAAARAAARERQPRPLLPSWLWGASLGAVAAVAVAILSFKLGGTASPHLGAPAGEGGLVARSPASAPPALSSAPAEAAEPAVAERYAASPPVPARRDRTAARAASKPAPPPAREVAPAADADRGPSEAEAKDQTGRLAMAQRKGDGPGAVPAAEEKGSAAGGIGAAAPPAPAQAMRLEAPPSRAKVASGVASAVRSEPLAPGRRAGTATFAGCPGETSREVEVDDRGRVVRYLRRGVWSGIAFEAELLYGDDGLLAEVRYRAGGEERVWRPGRTGVPAALLVPRRAADAGLDAPPRCGE